MPSDMGRFRYLILVRIRSSRIGSSLSADGNRFHELHDSNRKINKIAEARTEFENDDELYIVLLVDSDRFRFIFLVRIRVRVRTTTWW